MSASKSSTTTSGKKADSPNRPVDMSKKEIYTYFLLAVLLMATIFTYILLSKSRTDLSLAEDRLAKLEENLYNTDESKNKSVAALQAVQNKASKDIETNISEIKKLWAIAYQTNSKDIKSLQGSRVQVAQELENLGKSFDDISTLLNKFNSQQVSTLDKAIVRIKTSEGSLNILDDNLTKLKTHLEQIQKAVESAVRDALINQSSLVEIQGDLRKQYDSLIVAENLVKSNNQKLSSYESVFTDIKEQLLSINSHRRVLNIDINKLKKDVVKIIGDEKQSAEDALSGNKSTK